MTDDDSTPNPSSETSPEELMPSNWEEAHLYDTEDTFDSAYNLSLITAFGAVLLACPIYLLAFLIIHQSMTTTSTTPAIITALLTLGITTLISSTIINRSLKLSKALASDTTHLNTTYTWKEHLATIITPVTADPLPTTPAKLESFHKAKIVSRTFTPNTSPRYHDVTAAILSISVILLLSTVITASRILPYNSFMVFTGILMGYIIFPFLRAAQRTTPPSTTE